MKTLIVEDEFLNRLYHECQVQSLGFDLTSCADAETALEAYRRTFYPLILTDVGLPDMNGIELCRSIRALPHGEQSVILVISGSIASEDVQAAYAAGANEFLSKPVPPELLRERLAVYQEQQQTMEAYV
jgi:CheY-like chemotaxis protein